MTATLWGVVVFAGVVALAAPFVIRPLLHRVGSFDVPNHRSSHSQPTLRGGGLAPLLGIFAGGILATVASNGPAALFVGAITAAGVLMSLIGLVEDLRGLGVAVRAGTQFLVGGAVAVALGISVGFHWLWLPVAALFFAANVNFTNFMDGINGISGMHGLVAGLLYAGLGVISDAGGLVVSGLIIAVAFAAFLPWNFAAPGMFLGDVGSYLLGGLLAATAVAALAFGINPIASLAPLFIYWLDSVSTLLRRALKREPVFEAHRQHAYQRMVDAGHSHVKIALVVAMFSLAAGGVALLGTTTIAVVPGAVLIILAGLGGIYLGLPGFVQRSLKEPSA